MSLQILPNPKLNELESQGKYFSSLKQWLRRDPVSTSCPAYMNGRWFQAPPANHNFVLSQLDLTASLFYLLTSLALLWQPEELLNQVFTASHLSPIKAERLLGKWGFKQSWSFSLFLFVSQTIEKLYPTFIGKPGNAIKVYPEALGSLYTCQFLL